MLKNSHIFHFRHYSVYYIQTESLFNNTLGNPIEYLDQTDRLDIETIVNHLSRADTQFCVVFSSLSLPLLTQSAHELASLIRRLRDLDSVCKVISCLHTDVVSAEEVIQSVEYLFDTVVTLKPVTASTNQDYYGHVDIIRRKRNGKIETADELFALGCDFTLADVHDSTSAIKVIQETTSVDLSNLTFNLGLSDAERQAKNDLQLPYLKKASEKEALLTKTR